MGGVRDFGLFVLKFRSVRNQRSRHEEIIGRRTPRVRIRHHEFVRHDFLEFMTISETQNKDQRRMTAARSARWASYGTTLLPAHGLRTAGAKDQLGRFLNYLYP